MDLKDYLTVEQVARKIKLTEERVRELINLKQIKAVKIKGGISILLSSKGNLKFGV